MVLNPLSYWHVILEVIKNSVYDCVILVKFGIILLHKIPMSVYKTGIEKAV